MASSSSSNRNANICLIGNKFMGRAHANALLKVNRFFTDLPRQAVMHTVVGRNVEENQTFARMSIAALEAGRNVACEKPLAGSIRRFS